MTLEQLIELEKKATPGPWHADTSDPEDCVVWGAGDDGKFLANVGSDRMVPVRPDGAAILFDLDVNNCNLAVALRNTAPAYFEVVKAAKELMADCWCGGLGETCYCVCHSSLSSRPACIHCQPDRFKTDPYVHPCKCKALRSALARLEERGS